MAVPPKFTRKNLPSTLNARNKKLAKAKREQINPHLPKWATSPATLNRILTTYELYMKHTTLPRIMELQHVSVQTIYDDIKHAREFSLLKFQEDLRHCIMEQVHARQLLIDECRQHIADLVAGEQEAAGARAGRRGTYVTEDGDIRSLGADHNAETRRGHIGPLAANSIAQLMKVIGENEKAVEELLMLRDRKGTTENSPYAHFFDSGNPALPAAADMDGRVTLPGARQTYTVIDARTFDIDEGPTTLGGSSASGTVGEQFIEQLPVKGKGPTIIDATGR